MWMLLYKINISFTIILIYHMSKGTLCCMTTSMLHVRLGRPWPSGKGRWLQTTCPSPLWVRTRQGLWILSCEEAIQLAYGTSVVLLRYRFVPIINARKGTWGLSPPVKLERRDMTYTVSMWRKTQNKQKQTKHVRFFGFSISYKFMNSGKTCSVGSP
jgi:hypothetical protein